jgi:hypothetical protein
MLALVMYMAPWGSLLQHSDVTLYLLVVYVDDMIVLSSIAAAISRLIS